MDGSLGGVRYRAPYGANKVAVAKGSYRAARAAKTLKCTLYPLSFQRQLNHFRYHSAGIATFSPILLAVTWALDAMMWQNSPSKGEPLFWNFLSAKGQFASSAAGGWIEDAAQAAVVITLVTCDGCNTCKTDTGTDACSTVTIPLQ